MDYINVNSISKSYGNKQVLKDFSATIPKYKLTSIMAPSGFGKTTLLRILMRLEQADSGTITGLENCKFSAVFQEDRLCENLSPVANIRIVSPKSKQEIIDALKSVGLDGAIAQPVRELSGGMRRRVVILRALLADYDVLFLDEPLKGLDEKTKDFVMKDIREKSAGKTVILVTHEKSEVEALKVDKQIILE